jgi:hypothetical protein
MLQDLRLAGDSAKDLGNELFLGEAHLTLQDGSKWLSIFLQDKILL